MAKKSSKKSSSPQKKASTSSQTTKVSKTETLLALVLVVVALQLLLTLSLVVSGGSGSDSRIGNIESKVDALDEFFGTYVPEYNSPSGVQVAEEADDSGYGDSGVQDTSGNLEVDIEGEPTKGSADAPVLVAEFSDYECPFCGRFYSQSYHQLIEEYVDTGKVKFVFKDFPLSFHPNAEPASIAANCVQKLEGNDAYFEFHDTVFENQGAGLSASNLKTWAQAAGADADAYDTCIEDPKMQAEVQADFAEGSRLGISGTPSFIINGELVVGAQPYAVLKQVIESKLAES